MNNISIYKIPFCDQNTIYSSLNENLKINKLQTYNPILSLFFDFHNNYSNKCYTLRSKYILKSVDEKIEINDNDNNYIKHLFKCKVYDIKEKKDMSKEIFIKINSLLDPIQYMMNNYEFDSESKIPNIYNYLTNKKINSRNNTCYIDSFCSYLASKLVELKYCPTFPLFYGSFNGIAEEFDFNITEEYSDMKHEDWFTNNNEKFEVIKIENDYFSFSDESDSEEHINIGKDLDIDNIESSNTIKISSNGRFKNLKKNLMRYRFLENDSDTDECSEPDDFSVFNSRELDNGNINDNQLDGQDSDSNQSNTEEPDSNKSNCEESCSNQSNGEESDSNKSNCEESNNQSNGEESNNQSNGEESDNQSNGEESDSNQSNDEESNNQSNGQDSDSNQSNAEESKQEKNKFDICEEDIDLKEVNSREIIDELDIDNIDYDSENDLKYTKFSRLFNIPVQLICIENCNKTLDQLIEDKKYIISSTEWKSILFQICFGLAVGQKHFKLVHNDLHSSNIMLQDSNLDFLYFCKNSIFYKIPTFGKITKIIDFGRSTFIVNKKLFFSDVFKKDGDAEGQYSYPYHNTLKDCKIRPNFSFDLARLSTTIIEHFEFNTELWYLLRDWITDKYGICYINHSDDFDLYKKIAKNINSAIPKYQLNKQIFNEFIIPKNRIPKEEFIYYY